MTTEHRETLPLTGEEIEEGKRLVAEYRANVRRCLNANSVGRSKGHDAVMESLERTQTWFGIHGHALIASAEALRTAEQERDDWKATAERLVTEADWQRAEKYRAALERIRDGEHEFACGHSSGTCDCHVAVAAEALGEPPTNDTEEG